MQTEGDIQGPVPPKRRIKPPQPLRGKRLAQTGRQKKLVRRKGK